MLSAGARSSHSTSEQFRFEAGRLYKSSFQSALLATKLCESPPLSGCAVSAHGPEARKALALARESPGEVSQALEEEHSGLNEDLWSALSHKLDGVA